MYRWCDYRYVPIYVTGCYLCSMSLAVHVTTVIYIYMDNRQLQFYLCHWSCPIILLHSFSCNITWCGFCLIVRCLSDILCLWLFMIFITLLQDLFVYLCRLLYCYYDVLIFLSCVITGARYVDVNTSIWLIWLCPTNNTVSIVLLM